MVMFYRMLLSALVLIWSSLSFAISETATMSASEKELMKKILFDELRITGLDVDREKLMLKIYKKIKPILGDNWFAFWISNASWAKSKFKDSEYRFVYIVINNDNRLNHCLMVYYPYQKQLAVVVSEMPIGDSEVVINKYNELKKDKNFRVMHDAQNYAVFGHKEFVDYVGVRVKGRHGMVNYVYGSVINIPTINQKEEKK